MSSDPRRPSVFARVRQFFWPATETYDTRRSGGAEPGTPPPQHDPATDQRRHGNTGGFGG
ncbi:hypothetical protein [Microbacterium aurantiacum]|uniref:Uncharacterized protein n=1 Tax=Microbacterium aurantiacum TaxID=162393 RepID=A0AAJ2LYE7_9MICO|nr:hypothetical protein [Microbacterium aurantiacum]MBN9200372.1 hypothetical protein [Microbacterium chocolatum]MDS0244194.1 hypothetical protein [Microbacterium aurantiacum]OJU84566.1 MAG: hypothetical protein BGO11_16270 [Solirubrobacterales bacterium 70-9]